jgi:hypothetical protein
MLIQRFFRLQAVLCLSAPALAVVIQEPVEVGFESPLNLIALEARIQGQGPFRFILDSGAPGTVIDTELAKRIGLDTGRAVTRRSTAAGSQVTAASVQGGVTFALAPEFEVHVGQVITAPFTNTAQIMLGEHCDGILGSAFFFKYVIEVDYAERTLVFHDPVSYRYEGEGAILELDFPRMMSTQPFIRAELVNGERRLVNYPISVDSGGQTMGMASVGTRSEWDALVTPANRIIDVLGATGLSNDAEGTTHATYVTRMDRLTMGPFEFEGPQVSYSAGGAGFASMGASLLHRFTVVFDYSRKQMILEPNAAFDAPPMVDHSGLFIVMSATGDGTFKVLFVSDGTPAHEAGLTRDDVIRAVDGVPTSKLPLNDARVMFCRPAKYHLELQRDGRVLETVMETRSLFDG